MLEINKCIEFCFAVALLLISLIVYPFGLNSTFVKQQCGYSSGFFNSGTCQIAWGYMLAIVSTALLLFCPVIAYHLSVATPRSKATVVWLTKTPQSHHFVALILKDKDCFKGLFTWREADPPRRGTLLEGLPFSIVFPSFVYMRGRVTLEEG